MNKILIKLVLLLSGIMLFTGGACPSNETTPSNKVAQSEIYQSYSVAESGTNYNVTAYFRVGGKTGTTLALSPPSSITFNGQPMKENLNTSSGTYYSVTVPNTTADGTFVFTDRKGKPYTNKVDLSRVALSGKASRINSGAPFTLPLSGASAGTANLDLQFNRQMVFVNSLKSDTSEAYYDSTANVIVVNPPAWKDIPGGPLKVDLGVRNTIPTQQGTALGGEIAFNYDSAPTIATLIKGKEKTPAVNSNIVAKKRVRRRK